MRGIVRFGLLTDARGFDAIDDYDCREWLLLNGASRAAVDSAFVRALYDLGFSYEDGDPERPSIAARQSLRATIRAFFTYRGHVTDGGKTIRRNDGGFWLGSIFCLMLAAASLWMYLLSA